MEEENFLDLSIEEREDKLNIFSDFYNQLDINFAEPLEVQRLQNALPGVTQGQFKDAIIWSNTKKRNRYDDPQELNSKFPTLFPELKGLEFPKFDLQAGAVKISNPELNQDNAANKWLKIGEAIDRGTEIYKEINNPKLYSQGPDDKEFKADYRTSLIKPEMGEDLKLNLVQYNQVLQTVDPEYKKKFKRTGPDGEIIDPFEERESQYNYLQQAANFQGTKFKVNAMKHIAQNYGKDIYPYIKTNQDFFTFMPQLRDDEKFMDMYNSHVEIMGEYDNYFKTNFKEERDQKLRDTMQSLRLKGYGPMKGDYIATSLAVGIGGLVDKLGDLAGGIVEIGGKYGGQLLKSAPSPGVSLAANIVDRSIKASLPEETLKKAKEEYYKNVEETADAISGFFDTDNWKDTAIGQFAYIPDDIAGEDLSENPMLILPNTLKVVGEMIPAIVGSAYTGGLAAPVIMGGDQFFTSYHRTNQEARELGVDVEDREAMSLSIGTVTGVTSSIFNNPLARKGAAAMLGVRRNATQAAVNTLKSTGSRSASLKAGTSAYLKEVVGENIEEVIQGSWENYEKYKLDEKSPEPFYGASKFMSTTEFVNTLILTSAATSILVSPNVGVSQTQIEKESWTTAGLDYDNFEALVKSELKKKKPKFDETTANKMLEKAKVYQEIVKPMKEQNLPLNQIVEQAHVEYNALNNVPTEKEENENNEENKERKIEEIKNGLPAVGKIADGKIVSDFITKIGDTEVDEALASKLDNIANKAFKLQRIDLKNLYETNKQFKDFVDKNPDLVYENKSNKNSPGVVDNDGNVLDGMKRMAAAYNRGQKQMRVFTENEVKLNEVEIADINKELNNIISPKVEDKLDDIKKLGDHFQRVFTGSTISYDRDEFLKIAKASKHDPKVTKGLRNRENNQIYINPDLATLDTPIHEFAHIWEDMLAEINPKAHKKALKLIEGTKYHKSAIERDYGDRALNEALVDAIALKAAKVFKDPKRQTEFEKIIEEVKRIIKKALKIPAETDFDIQTNSLQEVIDSSVDKLMNAQRIQSPKQLNPSKPRGIDSQRIKLYKYNKEQRQAIVDFEALQDEIANDPTLSPLKPVIGKDGKVKFEKEKGKLKVKISGESYALVNGMNKFYDGTVEEKINTIGDKIVDEYNANQSIPEVTAGIGWYTELHKTFRNVFGGRTNLFGRLIGATSAQTDVRNNYKYAIEALKGYSKGVYDKYLEDYKSFLDRVEQYQDIEEINQFFNEYKGRAVNAIKESGGKATQEMRLKPDLKDINETKRKLINLYPKANPLYRYENPTLKYGINSPKVAQVLLGVWLKQTQQSKTNNFYKNVVGLTTNPTIDLWAARTIRRIIYGDFVPNYRISPKASTGIDERAYAAEAGGLSDYQLAEEVIINAADKLGLRPDNLQAYLWFAEKHLWKQNGWSKGIAAEKSDFRQEKDKTDVTRYFLGLSTERDSYVDPVLESKENKDIAEAQRKSIETDFRKLDVLSLKVNNTIGQYLDNPPEVSLDAELVIDDNFDKLTTIKQVVESAKKHEQDSVIFSEVIKEGAELTPNSRPAYEMQFQRSISFEEAMEFAQENLNQSGVQLGPVKTDITGFTFITTEDGARVIGVRTQFVPEYTFKNEEEITEENINQAMTDWSNNAIKISENLANKENILYFYPHYVDSFVARKEQYNDILNQINDGQRDLFKRSTKVSTKQYFQDGAKRIEAQPEGGTDFDAQTEQSESNRGRFSGTISPDDGGQISGIENRRIDTQKLPSQLNQLLESLHKRGYVPSKLVEAIKLYSSKVDGKELSTEDAREILSFYMASQGMRQYGFETGSITKAKDQDEAYNEVYDFINENPAYYKTMNMAETMDIVVQDIEERGGFEEPGVIEDLKRQGSTIEELPRVQLARQAGLRYFSNKLVKQRAEGAQPQDIEATLDVMGSIERALANEAAKAGQASAALRSWTAQTPASLIDRIEIAIQNHNDNVDNMNSVGKLMSFLFGKGKKIEQTELSAEQKDKITQYHELLSSIPENSEMANAVMRSAYKYMDSIVPSYTWIDTFYGLQYAALLSGISTQVLNFTSGMANVVLQPLMDMSRVDRMFNGTYFDFMRKFGKGTTKRGLEQGAALAKDILKNGARVDKYTDQQDSANINIKEGRYNVLESTEFKKLNVGGFDFNPYNYYKFVGRMLNATDRFIAKVGYEGRYFNYLVDQLRKDGVPTKDLRQKASDLYLATQVNRTAKKELQEQLDQLTKLDPTVDVSGIETVRIRELMHDALAKKYSEEFANKTDEELQAIKEAEFPGLDLSLEDFKSYLVSKKEAEIQGINEDANLASSAQVFIDKREGLTHPIASAAAFIRRHSNQVENTRLGRGKQFILKAFVPFTSIIGSIGEYMIDVTPVGGLARAYIAEEGLGKKGTRMRDEQLSRGYFGLMSFLGLAALALRNGQDEDDEPFVKISGGGFNNPSQYTRNDMKNAELPPYSIQFGGKTFDYRNIMPVSVPLAIIGNYNETFRSTGGKGELFEDVLNRTWVAIMNSKDLLIDQSVLTSVRDLLDAIGGVAGSGRGVQFDPNTVFSQDVTKRMERFSLQTVRSLGSMAARPLPQNLNLFRQITKIYDATSYSASDIEGSLAYAFGLSQIAGKPRIDIFGERAKSFPGETVIPYTHWLGLRGTDPRWQFIDKYNAYPGKIRNKAFKIGSQYRELTDDEMYQHQITTGQEFSKLLRKYMAKNPEEKIILKQGQSSSTVRNVIKRLWTIAQNKSFAKNKNSWKKTEL